MRFVLDRLPFAASGLLVALSSFYPDSWVGLLSLLVAVGFLAQGVRSSSSVSCDLFLFGLVFHAVAFYWLPDTITFFGGFPKTVSWFFFAVFCLTAAIQFLLCGVALRFLRKGALERLLFAFPLAWVALEMIFPRLFPWSIGHLTISLPRIAGVSEYLSVFFVSLLVLLWGELFAALWRSVKQRALVCRMGQIMVLVLTGVAFLLGQIRYERLLEEIDASPKVRAGLIQGNLEATQKGDIRFLSVNVGRYRALSKEAEKAGAELLFWPESVLNSWTPEQIGNVRGSEFDPYPGSTLGLLYGGLSYRRRPNEEIEALKEAYHSAGVECRRGDIEYYRFNSALGIDSAGNLLGRYHKQVLMPFGEYIPFTDTFPILKTISPQTGDFTPGDLTEPISFSFGDKLQAVIGPLICYEDLVSGPSRQFVKSGATLLVNLTNDAWYGDTEAPYQHHLLARWRAVETRRYLLRVTNTGYTAVVDPLGRTISSLPLFTESFLVQDVALLSGETFFASYGNLPMWFLLVLGFLTSFLGPRSPESRNRQLH